MSVAKELSSYITQFFVGHCPMSGTNVYTCSTRNKLWKKSPFFEFFVTLANGTAENS